MKTNLLCDTHYHYYLMKNYLKKRFC